MTRQRRKTAHLVVGTRPLCSLGIGEKERLLENAPREDHCYPCSYRSIYAARKAAKEIGDYRIKVVVGECPEYQKAIEKEDV